MLNLLILEDNMQVNSLVEKSLSKNFNVFTANTSLEALLKIKENKINVVISDFHLFEMNGVDFLKKIDESVFKILLTGDEDNQIVKKSINEKAFNLFIKKPFSLHNLGSFILEKYVDLKKSS